MGKTIIEKLIEIEEERKTKKRENLFIVNDKKIKEDRNERRKDILSNIIESECRRTKFHSAILFIFFFIISVLSFIILSIFNIRYFYPNIIAFCAVGIIFEVIIIPIIIFKTEKINNINYCEAVITENQENKYINNLELHGFEKEGRIILCKIYKYSQKSSYLDGYIILLVSIVLFGNIGIMVSGISIITLITITEIAKIRNIEMLKDDINETGFENIEEIHESIKTQNIKNENIEMYGYRYKFVKNAVFINKIFYRFSRNIVGLINFVMYCFLTFFGTRLFISILKSIISQKKIESYALIIEVFVAIVFYLVFFWAIYFIGSLNSIFIEINENKIVFKEYILLFLKREKKINLREIKKIYIESEILTSRHGGYTNKYKFYNIFLKEVSGKELLMVRCLSDFEEAQVLSNFIMKIIESPQINIEV